MTVRRHLWLTLIYQLLSLVIYSLHKFGIHIALYLAAGFSISGMWLRFAGAKANSSSGGQFGLVMFGQILIGMYFEIIGSLT